MSADRCCYRARWVFPVCSPPIENGVVEIVAGRIQAVHDKQGTPATDLGNVAIIPGLINAHTHLEFSELTQPLDTATPFAKWIQTLVAHRHSRPVAAETAVRLGYNESAIQGTALLGEIATNDWPAHIHQSGGPGVVVFRELLALSPDRIDEQLTLARRHLEQIGKLRETSLIAGLSPHAPYSVHPDLFRSLVDLAKETDAPVAIHLAETQAELQLLKQGTGELVDMLEKFGVWNDSFIPRGSRPLDYLRKLAELKCGLVIHGNYLNDEDIEFLADCPQLTVVYCPRTHAYFGHERHPWQQLLDHNVRVALGTDSRASNPNLSLWEELRFLRKQFPTVSPETLLALGTQHGAAALGLADSIGTITPGNLAKLAIVALPNGDGTDAYSLLFAGEHCAALPVE